MFTLQQQNEINRILLEYKSNEESRKAIEDKYDTSTYELSIIQIYAIEEIIRYGTKGIYKSYIEINNSNNKIEEYDDYMKKLTTDIEFSTSKLLHIKDLTKVELFITSIMLNSVVKKNNFELYDPIIEIRTSSEKESRETIKDLIIGVLAHIIVECSKTPEKYKQRNKGQFSPESKKRIIDAMRKDLIAVKIMVEYISYLIFDIEPEENEGSMGFWIPISSWYKFATNISYDEVIGKKPKSLK